MVNNRNGFTYVSNIFVLAFSLVMFLFISSPTLQFRILALVCVVLGAMTTLFYILVIKENALQQKAKDCERTYQIAIGNRDPQANISES